MGRPRSPWFGIIEKNLSMPSYELLELIKGEFPDAKIDRSQVSAQKIYIKKSYGLLPQQPPRIKTDKELIEIIDNAAVSSTDLKIQIESLKVNRDNLTNYIKDLEKIYKQKAKVEHAARIRQLKEKYIENPIEPIGKVGRPNKYGDRFDELIEANLELPTSQICKILQEKNPDDDIKYGLVYYRTRQLRKMLGIENVQSRPEVPNSYTTIEENIDSEEESEMSATSVPKSNEKDASSVIYDGKSVIRIEDLARAIQLSYSEKNKYMDKQSAIETASHVLKFFGFDERIIDNVLEPADRNAFYMLEDYKLLTTESEETTLYDGREWRIHYWILNKPIIQEFLNNGKSEEKEKDNQNVYENVPAEVWKRD